MTTENSIIMKQARESLSGKWGLVVGTFFLYMLIPLAVQQIPKGGGLLSLIIAGPMLLGLSIFSLALSRNNNPEVDQLFAGFSRFGTALSAYLLIILFVILWSLLLIIPGIIASISYSMTFFILTDDKSITPKEALDRSKKMMDGYKWKYFYLQCRFIGWTLLCILTIGIGFLWLVPYIQISKAKFYEDIKNKGLEVVAV